MSKTAFLYSAMQVRTGEAACHAGLGVFATKDEAIGVAYAKALERNPTTEGWAPPSVIANPIDIVELEQICREIRKETTNDPR